MRVAVLKLGGSVLTGLDAYQIAAATLRASLAAEPTVRLIVVVSAQLGATDEDLALARSLSANPDPRALDLLWSTGEQRSVALLTLALQAEGIAALGLNVHEMGLRLSGGPAFAAGAPRRFGEAGFEARGSGTGGREIDLNVLRLKAALAHHPIVVVPGFLARGAGDRIVSLGRGGSDLTAVLLAVALDANRCELVKDVPGYFTDDPAIHPDARRLPELSYAEALARETGGCQLVQRAAIEAAAQRGLTLIVRSLDAARGHTLLTESTETLEPESPRRPFDKLRVALSSVEGRARARRGRPWGWGPTAAEERTSL
jgi:aspartate kinase